MEIPTKCYPLSAFMDLMNDDTEPSGDDMSDRRTIAREIEAAHAHLISDGPPLARALEAARESGHASAGQLDSLWRHVDGLSEVVRALLVFIEYAHVPKGDEQVEMPL